MISTRRRHTFCTGKKARYRAPLPVIVVGNITAGGNGKTLVVDLVSGVTATSRLSTGRGFKRIRR
ncbi:tetraacyldisaccharide 4'-kinase [Vibrio metschnikovii]